MCIAIHRTLPDCKVATRWQRMRARLLQTFKCMPAQPFAPAVPTCKAHTGRNPAPPPPDPRAPSCGAIVRPRRHGPCIRPLHALWPSCVHRIGASRALFIGIAPQQHSCTASYWAAGAPQACGKTSTTMETPWLPKASIQPVSHAVPTANSLRLDACAGVLRLRRHNAHAHTRHARLRHTQLLSKRTLHMTLICYQAKWLASSLLTRLKAFRV